MILWAAWDKEASASFKLVDCVGQPGGAVAVGDDASVLESVILRLSPLSSPTMPQIAFCGDWIDSIASVGEADAFTRVPMPHGMVLPSSCCLLGAST